MIPHLTLDKLTEAEKRLYEDGEWLEPAPVSSVAVEHLRRGPDLGEDAAAELWARVRIMLEAR